MIVSIPDLCTLTYFKPSLGRNIIFEGVVLTWVKKDAMVACSVILDNHCNIQRISDGLFIFTVKSRALDLASVDLICSCVHRGSI